MVKKRVPNTHEWRSVIPTSFSEISDWEKLVIQKFPKYANWPKGKLNRELHAECNHKLTTDMIDIMRKGAMGNQHILIKLKSQLPKTTVPSSSQVTLDIPNWIITALTKEAEKFGIPLDSRIKLILGEYASKVTE